MYAGYLYLEAPNLAPVKRPLFLIHDMVRHDTFEMRKLVLHVGDLNGFDKLLLKILFHCQFNIFHY